LSEEVASFAGNLVAIKRELGDTDGAVVLVEEALDGHRKNGHQIGQISMYNELGLILHAAGKLERAIEAYESGLRLAEANGLGGRRSTLLTHCASALLDRGDVNRARELSLEALRIVLATGLVGSEPMCRCTLAAIESAAGDADAAREQLIESIPVARKMATVPAIVLMLRGGANFMEQRGDPALALRLIACADSHRGSQAALIARYRNTADRLRRRLDPSVVATAEAAGAALSLDAGLDELAHALAGHG
jgi:tetratricopeptide (TPR) repeat protein